MTKQNKKEIKVWIEAVVYILCIIVVVTANVFGPIQIRMVPLLFILGIVGRLAFNRPVMTSVFSMVVAICISYLGGITKIPENLAVSFAMGLYVAIGEIFGLFVKNALEMLQNKKKRWHQKNLAVYGITVLVLILVLLLHSYTESNGLVYMAQEEHLKTYLKETYPNTEFKITGAKYQFLGAKNFKFTVKNVDNTASYLFVSYLDEKYGINDGYQASQLEEKEKEANLKLQAMITEKEKTETWQDLSITIGYDTIAEPLLQIEKEIGKIDENAINEFSQQVAEIIEGLLEFRAQIGLEQIQICLNNTDDSTKSLSSYVYFDKYQKNQSLQVESGEEYIKRALKVEYID